MLSYYLYYSLVKVYIAYLLVYALRETSDYIYNFQLIAVYIGDSRAG